MVFLDDTLYYSGSAPGFDSFIYAIDTQGAIVLRSPVDGMPAGIDTMSDGSLVYADYELGEIRIFRPFASDEILARDLPYPVGLVVGPDDRIFLSASDADAIVEPGTVIEAPRRRILVVEPGGTAKELYRFDTGSVTFFDVDSSGVLYIPLGDRLCALHPDGRLQTLAEGFSEARDAKLAPDGSIYVTDTGRSALYRLVR
jgi:DNA-binding beta-propeller fold protein YncE